MPVDVLALRDPWVDGALTNPPRDPAGLPVVPRPFLILLKLESGRTQDLADVQRVLGGTPTADRALARTVVARYAPQWVEDFDSLVMLADLEFGPPPA